jgi:hypothetical protein
MSPETTSAGQGPGNEAVDDRTKSPTISRMASRKPISIRAVSTPAGFRIERPGARYAAERAGDEYRGVWLPDEEPLSEARDTFTEGEARLLLPLLRDMEGMAAGKGGRPAAVPTSPDGQLIARACKRLGLSAATLAERIGAHQSVLSRARHGELPEAHRTTIRTLLKNAARRAPSRPRARS